MTNYIAISNHEAIPEQNIPVLNYEIFLELNTSLMIDPFCHCVSYFGNREENRLKLYCCMANDQEQKIYISACEIAASSSDPLPSFTARHLAFHIFEREIHENSGIAYSDHPWLKPVRYPFNRADQNSEIANYPFYKIDSEELHEVGVGPIHAGIIEPGHFRFICNGEQILHLEIQLGYQHRGLENLMLQKKTILQRTTLAESIAGDTVAGHTTAFINLWESLCGFGATPELMFARTLALEMERIAVHTGDISAICTDIAYQLGSAVFGRLRTPLINYMQAWCGNRLGKGLLRAGKNQYPLTPELADKLNNVLDAFMPDFMEMYKELKTLPSALARLEKTGIVDKETADSIGAVGVAAKASGLYRDIRSTHPHDYYKKLRHHPIMKHHGDVYSRMQTRKEEIVQSVGYLRKMLANIPEKTKTEPGLKTPGSGLFAISLTEGWRGEICHCAITGVDGELKVYKVKDPSMHNWLALALSVRNNEISDFPICNKSFNLSYCGNDL